MENTMELSQKVKIELPYDPAVPLLATYTEETKFEKKKMHEPQYSQKHNLQ